MPGLCLSFRWFDIPLFSYIRVLFFVDFAQVHKYEMAKAAKALCWPGEFRILWKALDKDPVVFGALGLQLAVYLQRRTRAAWFHIRNWICLEQRFLQSLSLLGVMTAWCNALLWTKQWQNTQCHLCYYPDLLFRFFWYICYICPLKLWGPLSLQSSVRPKMLSMLWIKLRATPGACQSVTFLRSARSSLVEHFGPEKNHWLVFKGGLI